MTYAPRVHCNDAPWWQQGAPIVTPSTVAYEGATDFDAFVPTEILMSGQEVRALHLHIGGYRVAADTEHSSPQVASFLAAAAPQPPLGALLIAETAGNATRLWGVGVGENSNSPDAPTPFCDWGGAAGAYFLKTGGDPSKTEGWDQGFRDKCCSVDPTDCVWFGTLAGCEAQNPASCRQCRPGQVDMGCPSWTTPPSTLPLAYKYLSVAPSALASQAATVLPNQNYSWQLIVVAPQDDFLTVESVVFAGGEAAGVKLSCFSTEVRACCIVNLRFYVPTCLHSFRASISGDDPSHPLSS